MVVSLKVIKRDGDRHLGIRRDRSVEVERPITTRLMEDNGKGHKTNGIHFLWKDYTSVCIAESSQYCLGSEESQKVKSRLLRERSELFVCISFVSFTAELSYCTYPPAS